MYLSHFGLREVPFGLTPDTSFAFACTPHQQALNTLLVAVANGEGFIKITGEVGMGKTLLCRRFLSQLEGDFVTAYIADPLLDSLGLLRALSEELRLSLSLMRPARIWVSPSRRRSDVCALRVPIWYASEPDEPSEETAAS